MRRVWRVVLVLVGILVINYPVIHRLVLDHRLSTDGRPVTAQVVGARQISGDSWWLNLRFPSDVDAEGRDWPIYVDRPTYDRAVRSHELQTRALPGSPGVYEADGQVVSKVGWVVTIVADVVLAGIVLLAWRLRGRRRVPLVALAVEDVQPGAAGSALDRQSDGTHLVRGEVTEAGADRLVLELGDRSVTVHLGDHANPVGTGETAQVRARLVG